MTKHATNVYDFDHTVYRGDVSIDFIIYCMTHQPRLWVYLPHQFLAVFHYVLGTWTRQHVKQEVFSFLHGIKDIDATLDSFWEKHKSNIASWYIAQREDTDIIISASPDFILERGVNRLGIRALIATSMDRTTGKIIGNNCRGQEKLKRLQEYDASLKIGNCYSDSLTDMPLLSLAEHAFVVRKGLLIPLGEYKPSKLQTLYDPAFLRFLLVGGVNASLGILFSFIISLLIQSAVLAFVFGFTLSLFFSYILNALITFRDRNFSVLQFLRFCLSYLPNFIILFIAVHILVDTLHVRPLFSYVLAAVISAPITFLLLAKFTFILRKSE